MPDHRVGDLVLHIHPKLNSILGIIQKVKKNDRYDVYWCNPIVEEDVSIESEYSISIFKRYLQEFMDEQL